MKILIAYDDYSNLEGAKQYISEAKFPHCSVKVETISLPATLVSITRVGRRIVLELKD